MEPWHCPGCGDVRSGTDADEITRHVAGCDYVDGAGQPVELTLKFSHTAWHIVRIRSDQLAEVTGGMPFGRLRGPVEDGPDDEETEDAITEFLTGLAYEDEPAETDGYEIGDVYPAARDEPPSGLPQA
jgi:hypothetical protein